MFFRNFVVNSRKIPSHLLRLFLELSWKSSSHIFWKFFLNFFRNFCGKSYRNSSELIFWFFGIIFLLRNPCGKFFRDFSGRFFFKFIFRKLKFIRQFYFQILSKNFTFWWNFFVFFFSVFTITIGNIRFSRGVVWWISKKGPTHKLRK